MPGTLYLLPTPIALGPEKPSDRILDLLNTLTIFITEEPKTTRRFIRSVLADKDIQSCTFLELSEHTEQRNLSALLEPLLAGHDVGLLSEAGAPCIADPGADLVRMAHQHDIRVVPCVGPSSIMLAVMASGLNGQQFVFHGYPPKDPDKRRAFFSRLEAESKKNGYAHFFIETPYRVGQVFSELIHVLSPNSLLFIGSEISGEHEQIKTSLVSEWKRADLSLGKSAAIIGILGA